MGTIAHVRSRHMHQIIMLDTTFGQEFQDALYRLIRRSNCPMGLSLFTDEQIAAIRAEMIQRRWFRHKLNRENRKLWRAS